MALWFCYVSLECWYFLSMLGVAPKMQKGKFNVED